MTLAQRFGYYLGGFSIGLVFLFFFFSGKRTSCAYGPNARVKKNISTKKLRYAETIDKEKDSLLINTILHYGKVNFSKSNTELDSCKQYIIQHKIEKQPVEVLVENCDAFATILQLKK